MAMTSRDLEAYFHSHIPLTRAMQVRAISVEPDGVVLGAPLAPNVNHKQTVFGGSAATLATLAAWAIVHTRLIAAGQPGRLVIQRNTMSFDRPISGDFTARGAIADPEAWSTFTRLLERRGKARI